MLRFLRSTLSISKTPQNTAELLGFCSKVTYIGSYICSKFHSDSITITGRKMEVKILPALQDNYMYLIVNKDTREAAVVDPVNPQTVISNVEEGKLILKNVLTTHHHWDHSGGNEEIFKLVPGLKVYGGDERVGALTHKVMQGDVINIGDIKIECLFTPAHTSGHICYYVTHKDCDPLVFTGDTLFSAGCGRLFEGNAKQMNHSLNDILSNLPDKTKVYCGHEYTVNNLKFSLHVEPDNSAVRQRFEWASKQRENHLPTVPSTIGDEKKFNPFMRVNEPTLKKYTNETDPVKVLAALRKEKDEFKG